MFKYNVFAQTFNLHTNITNRCNLPTDHVVSLTDIGNHQIHATYDKKVTLYPGEIFQMRDAIRDEACGFIHLSKNIILEHFICLSVISYRSLG